MAKVASMSCFLHAVKQNGVRCIGRHTCPDVNTPLRWVSVEFDFTLVAESLLFKKNLQPASAKSVNDKPMPTQLTSEVWSVHLQALKVSQAREYCIFRGWPISCHTGTLSQFLVPIAKSHCKCRAHARRPNPKSQKNPINFALHVVEAHLTIYRCLSVVFAALFSKNGCQTPCLLNVRLPRAFLQAAFQREFPLASPRLQPLGHGQAWPDAGTAACEPDRNWELWIITHPCLAGHRKFLAGMFPRSQNYRSRPQCLHAKGTI